MLERRDVSAWVQRPHKKLYTFFLTVVDDSMSDIIVFTKTKERLTQFYYILHKTELLDK